MTNSTINPYGSSLEQLNLLDPQTDTTASGKFSDSGTFSANQLFGGTSLMKSLGLGADKNQGLLDFGTNADIAQLLKLDKGSVFSSNTDVSTSLGNSSTNTALNRTANNILADTPLTVAEQQAVAKAISSKGVLTAGQPSNLGKIFNQGIGGQSGYLDPYKLPVQTDAISVGTVTDLPIEFFDLLDIIKNPSVVAGKADKYIGGPFGQATSGIPYVDSRETKTFDGVLSTIKKQVDINNGQALNKIIINTHANGNVWPNLYFGDERRTEVSKIADELTRKGLLAPGGTLILAGCEIAKSVASKKELSRVAVQSGISIQTSESPVTLGSDNLYNVTFTPDGKMQRKLLGIELGNQTADDLVKSGALDSGP